MTLNFLKLILIAAFLAFLSATFCVSAEAKPTHEKLEQENKALDKKPEAFEKSTQGSPAQAKSSAASASSGVKTFHDALINGKISGEAKIWYQTNDSDANDHIFASDNSWMDAGLRLSYQTSYKGFTAKVSFFAVDDLWGRGNYANKSMVGLIDGDDTKTYLGEISLSYQYANTVAKIGRMDIKSPLVNSDTWMIFPNNFEAYMITNTDISDTTVVAGFVTEERRRYDEQFKDFYDNGVAMLGAVNKSIANTTLSGYIYHTGDDERNTNPANRDLKTTAGYLEAKTEIGTLGLAAQYIGLNPHSSGTHSTQAMGGKVSTKVGDFDMYIAYTYVGDGYWRAANISDAQAKTPLYTATISGDGDVAGRPDTESFAIAASTKIMEDFNVTAKYAYYSFDDSKYYYGKRTTTDGDGTTLELFGKYTGWDHITVFSGIWYTDHEGVGAYNGKPNSSGTSAEDLITFRVWAKYEF